MILPPKMTHPKGGVSNSRGGFSPQKGWLYPPREVIFSPPKGGFFLQRSRPPPLPLPGLRAVPVVCLHPACRLCHGWIWHIVGGTAQGIIGITGVATALFKAGMTVGRAPLFGIKFEKHTNGYDRVSTKCLRSPLETRVQEVCVKGCQRHVLRVADKHCKHNCIEV